MKIDILTIFPDYFTSPFAQSLIGKAIKKGVLDIKTWDIREFSNDKHKIVDDVPYGGGSGMVMKIEPVYECLQNVEGERGLGYKVLLTPKGNRFNQKMAVELSKKEHLILICGRYEGIDERIYNFIDDDLSIGDYIVMGGEVAALVVVEAVVRLVKGVVGKESSVKEESFSDGLLEYPQYTRPYDFLGYKVPDVLLSGDHQKIAKWRREQAELLTARKRPDLLNNRNN